MANNKATAYITAKNRIGCKEPIGLKDLDFIQFGFLVFSGFPGVENTGHSGYSHIDILKVFSTLV
jgi:hypothetical protein